MPDRFFSVNRPVRKYRIVVRIVRLERSRLETENQLFDVDIPLRSPVLSHANKLHPKALDLHGGELILTAQSSTPSASVRRSARRASIFSSS